MCPDTIIYRYRAKFSERINSVCINNTVGLLQGLMLVGGKAARFPTGCAAL